MSDDALQDAIQKAFAGASPAERLFGHRELKALPQLLEDGELPVRIIQGRIGNAQGILVATDRRLLFVDRGLFGTKTTGFRYGNITSIEFGTGLAYGHITITVSGRTTKIDQLFKDRVQEFVNVVRSKMAESRAPATPPRASIADELERLAQLRDAGHITDDEFQRLKQRLLDA